VTNEEQRLSEVLHRLTPEPPRRVTPEQVAYRLVSQPARGHAAGRGRVPRPRRGGFSRAWAPLAAAAAVVVIAGAGVGFAALASHHSTPPTAGGGPATSSAASTATSSAPPATSASERPQSVPTTLVAGGPWAAAVIDHTSLAQDPLVSSGGSLYGYGQGTLDRIDPATGSVAASTRYSAPLPNAPVVVGSTVWVVWSFSGGNVVLHGYNAQTLAQTSSLLVPATGPVASPASSVLASGPDGHLYVAAGRAVAVVDPASGQIANPIYLTGGTASSIAVSPDGSKVYVGLSASGQFRLLTYDLSSATEVASSVLPGTSTGGNLIATSGGVWGTTGTGQSEWTWFAPNGNLANAVRVGQGAGGGFGSVPSYSGGVVWIGGTGDLVCASPATGKVLAAAAVPTDHGVVEYFGSPVLAGDHAYAAYADSQSSLTGLARLTPPAACSGMSS
jgi:hypothetical protein